MCDLTVVKYKFFFRVTDALDGSTRLKVDSAAYAIPQILVMCRDQDNVEVTVTPRSLNELPVRIEESPIENVLVSEGGRREKCKHFLLLSSNFQVLHQ